ncbi:MAG: PIN domain-containing protein [Pyrinomonadaceae bacterium]|nr:PIN domain-containing protein [Pyrinomonadaceae bacterium]
MNGTNAVLDSNAIILGSKGKIDIEELLSRYDKFFASIISYAECYAYHFQDRLEKIITDEIFSNLEIIELDQPLADQSIIYRKNKIKKIKLPDAVILATAKLLNADLLTDDWDDFLKIDSSVNVLSLDDLRT